MCVWVCGWGLYDRSKKPSVSQTAKTYIHQLCADTGYHVDDLLSVIGDREGWAREIQRNLCCWYALMMIMAHFLEVIILFLLFWRWRKWMYRVLEKSILCCNILTWSILVPMISNFNSICGNNSNFYIQCLNTFSFQVNGISIPEKKKSIKQIFEGKCPWCNGYRRRKWTRWHEFKSWMRLIAFHIALIPFGKGINPIILPPAMGK